MLRFCSVLSQYLSTISAFNHFFGYLGALTPQNWNTKCADILSSTFSAFFLKIETQNVLRFCSVYNFFKGGTLWINNWAKYRLVIGQFIQIKISHWLRQQIFLKSNHKPLHNVLILYWYTEYVLTIISAHYMLNKSLKTPKLKHIMCWDSFQYILSISVQSQHLIISLGILEPQDPKIETQNVLRFCPVHSQH